MNYNPFSILAGIVILSSACFFLVSLVDFLFIKFIDRKNENEWSKTAALASTAVLAWLISVALALLVGSARGLSVFIAVFFIPFFAAMYFVSGKIYKLSLPNHLVLIVLISVILNPAWLSLMGAL